MIAWTLTSMILLFWAAGKLGPYVEGYFWPVAVATQVSLHHHDDDTLENWTVLEGMMDKRRSCDFRSMRGFLIDPDTNLDVIAPIDTQESVKLRQPGDHSWGPWRVFSPVFEVEKKGKFIIETWHECHPFWLTRSVFWTSSGQRDWTE